MEKLKDFISNKKVIISVIALLLLSLVSFVAISNITTSKGQITVDTKVEEKLTSSEEQKVEEYILVDIKGEVKTPGVYKLPVNSRVIDAIKASGGLTKKAVTTYINLSKTLKDENVIIINKKSELKKIEEKKNIEEIKINDNSSVSVKTTDVITNDVDKVKEETTTESVTKAPEEGTSSANENSSETKKETTSVNINESSIEELTTISGIGESKAKAIIEYRTANGPFKSIEDIKNVSGIGDKLYDKIKTYITIR